MTVKHIDNVTDIKAGQYGMSSKIHSGGEHWFCNEDASYMKGKTIQFDAEEKTSKAGGKYRIARNIKVVEDAPPATAAANGVLHWPDYENILRNAHRLIMELEPDQYGGPVHDTGDPEKNEDIPHLIVVDRSRARVAFLSTIAIAASNGRIAVEDNSDVPF